MIIVIVLLYHPFVVVIRDSSLGWTRGSASVTLSGRSATAIYSGRGRNAGFVSLYTIILTLLTIAKC
jgi:hypothetical protein